MASILPITDTCAKIERGYCSSAFMEKTLSQVFKIPSGFPGITLGKQVVKIVQKMVLYFGEGGFGGGRWYFGPP